MGSFAHLCAVDATKQSPGVVKLVTTAMGGEGTSVVYCRWIKETRPEKEMLGFPAVSFEQRDA